jgi:hypothetical protein
MRGADDFLNLIVLLLGTTLSSEAGSGNESDNWVSHEWFVMQEFSVTVVAVECDRLGLLVR